MADLTYLNEGAVLHNLKQRYYYKLIYVSVNSHLILIAIFFLSLSSPIDLFNLLQNKNKKINGCSQQINKKQFLKKKKSQKNLISHTLTNIKPITD